jgi:dolichyl-phosphate-mannose-protein mannosyltransferase
MYQFNIGLGAGNPHPFQSAPWTWLFGGKPYTFESGYIPGAMGALTLCGSSEGCFQAIMPISNPIVWWPSILTILFMVVLLLWKKDRTAGVLLLPIIGGYLPWFLYQNRIIFQYYVTAFEPIIVIIDLYVLAWILSKLKRQPVRVLVRILIAGFVVAGVLVSIYFWCFTYAGVFLDVASYKQHLWEPTWTTAHQGLPADVKKALGLN